MAIVKNDAGSWPNRRVRVGSYRAICGTQYAVDRTTRRTAYRDTEFHRKRKEGLPLAFMPYENYLIDQRQMPIPANNLVGAISCYGWLSYTFTGASNSVATTELLKKLADQQWNAAVTFGELPETIKMIGSTAKRLAGAMRNLKRGNVKGTFRALGISDNVRLDSSRYARFQKSLPKKYKTAADHRRSLTSRRAHVKTKTALNKFAAQSWLELQYGWVPTLSDTYNMAEQLARRLKDAEHDIVVTGYSFGKVTFSPGAGTLPIVALKAQPVKNFVIRREARYKITNRALREASAFGLTNPLLVAWELLPLSFVIDWFLPVGDFIQTVSADAGTQYIDGGFSNFKLATFHCYNPPKNSAGVNIGSAEGTMRVFHLVRTTASAPAAVPPRLRRLSEFMNLKRFTDAISLGRVIFGK